LCCRQEGSAECASHLDSLQTAGLPRASRARGVHPRALPSIAIGTLFASFYAISAMANYGAATRFGRLIIITVPLWHRHISAELRMEGTLWALWALTIGSVASLPIELLFVEIRRTDGMARSIADRLASVEEVLACYVTDRSVDEMTEKRITRLAMLGISRLRRILWSFTHSRDYKEQMSAVVALVGRLVDIAANLTRLSLQIF
jgi:multidrug resistance protein MdtO